jgi:hypothetical protein
MYMPNFLDGFDRLVAFDAETTGKRTPDAEFIRKQPFARRAPGIIIEVGFVEMLQAARRYLTGVGKFPKGEGKDVVFQWCQRLGWNPANMDESDAMAIWAMGCGQMSPAMAAMTTPLFAER